MSTGEARLEFGAEAVDAPAIGPAVTVADPGSGAEMQPAGRLIDSNFKIVYKTKSRRGEFRGEVGPFSVRDPAALRFDGCDCGLEDVIQCNRTWDLHRW